MRGGYFVAFSSCYLLLATCCLSHRREQDCLLSVQAILCLLEDDGARRIDDIGSYFVSPVGWQAVHEDGVRLGVREQGGVDLVGHKDTAPLLGLLITLMAVSMIANTTLYVAGRWLAPWYEGRTSTA